MRGTCNHYCLALLKRRGMASTRESDWEQKDEMAMGYIDNIRLNSPNTMLELASSSCCRPRDVEWLMLLQR